MPGSGLPDPNAPRVPTDAILDRIARARKYKEGGGSSPAPGGGSSVPAAPALPNVGPTKVDWGAMVSFLEAPKEAELSSSAAGGLSILPPGQQLTPEQEEAARAARERAFMAPTESKDYMQILMNTPRREGAGSAEQAASSLSGVLATRDVRRRKREAGGMHLQRIRVRSSAYGARQEGGAGGLGRGLWFGTWDAHGSLQPACTQRMNACLPACPPDLRACSTP